MSMGSAQRAAWVAVMMWLVGVPAAWAEGAGDHLRPCAMTSDEQWCAVTQKTFTDGWAGAYSGDYQGQRNVSYCLSTGCDGAVQVNAVLGCAWRIVILASGSDRVDETDRGNFDVYCSHKLDAIDLRTAISQARKIYKKVYKEPLPPEFGGP